MRSEPRFVDYAIIGDPREPRVLLLPRAGGWSLPYVQQPERHFWQSVASVNRAMRDLLGLAVTTLRCVRTDYERNVYAMETHSRDWLPPAGAGWFAADQIAGLPLVEPDHRALLRDWFAWNAASAVPANRPPWYMPGWFAEASEWIQAQLGRLGMRLTAPIEQLRSWERSAILRADTDAGPVYFKAVPAMFAHEPALTQALAARDPAHFPTLLAVDDQQHWFLMPDMGSHALDKVGDVRRWEAALRSFAQTQIDLAGQVDHLLALGCPRRPLDELAANIDQLLADTTALTPESFPLSAAQIAELRGRAPEFKAMCAALASYRVPQTLEHGDFSPGQVVLQGDTNIFIDWSDSSIAHPFFSMNFFTDLAELAEFLPDVPDLRARLRDAYLASWTIYEPPGRLVEVYELAQQLSALHNAIIYHRHILPRMESKWEMWNMIPFYLRKLVAA
jgi:hypothetical protein